MCALSSITNNEGTNERMNEKNAKLNCNLDHKTHTDQGYRLASDAVYLSHPYFGSFAQFIYLCRMRALSLHLVHCCCLRHLRSIQPIHMKSCVNVIIFDQPLQKLRVACACA